MKAIGSFCTNCPSSPITAIKLMMVMIMIMIILVVIKITMMMKMVIIMIMMITTIDHWIILHKLSQVLR